MRDPKKRAVSNACHWLNKCYDLGVTAEEVVAQSAASQMAASQKENEGEKRNSPLEPPIEKNPKQEKTPLRYVFADANGKVDVKAIAEMVGPVDVVPTLDVYLAWCEAVGFKDTERCKQCYNDHIFSGWRDAKGKIIKNWPREFLKAMRRNPHRGSYKKLPADIKTMFDGFWKEYPPRRRGNKDDCASLFRRILFDSGDPVRQFNAIMEGLAKWKASTDWTKECGEYVMMPYRWLGNRYWEMQPAAGYIRPRRGVSQTANVQLGKERLAW